MSRLEMARKLLDGIGGPDNISYMVKSKGRLYFTFRKSEKVNIKYIQSLNNIIYANKNLDNNQIEVESSIDDLYAQLEDLIKDMKSYSGENQEDVEKELSIINRIFSTISGIFTPLLPLLAGAGVLRGLTILAEQLNIIEKGSDTDVILTVTAMSIFHFLPIFLAFTSAKKFSVNPYISAVIGAALLNPELLSLMGDEGVKVTVDFAGIPTVLMDYSSTVIPIIVSIWLYSYLEYLLKRYIPKSAQLVFIPMISLIIMVPFTLIVIGPLGGYGGELIASVVNSLLEANGLLAGLLVGGFWSVLVVFGLQWALNPIMINNVSELGFDYIVPLTFACNFAVIGTALGVFFKTKHPTMKGFSLSSVVTIVLSGIIEPVLYGLLIKNKRLFIIQIIGGALGGAFIGASSVSANAFVFGGGVTIPAFVGGNFLSAMIGLLISTVVSAVLTYFLFKDESKGKKTYNQ